MSDAYSVGIGTEVRGDSPVAPVTGVVTAPPDGHPAAGIADVDDDLFVLLSAALCDPRQMIRLRAALRLARLVPPQADMLISWTRRAIRRPELLERVLRLRNMDRDEAAARLTAALLSAPPPVRQPREETARIIRPDHFDTIAPAPSPVLLPGAVASLGVLRYRPAAPLLLERMVRANAEGYVTIARALARIGAPEVIPVLAALTLPARGAAEFPVPELRGGDERSLHALIRAARWLSNEAERSRVRHRFLSEAEFDELRAADRQDPDFAGNELWDLGEAFLLRAVHGLAEGDAAPLTANPDPRMFEALVVGLSLNPGHDSGRAGMAAVAGLEAIGDARCLAVLGAYSDRLALGAHRGAVRAARAARACVARRLAEARGVLSPAAEMAGTGSEIAPGAAERGAEC